MSSLEGIFAWLGVNGLRSKGGNWGQLAAIFGKKI